MRSAVARGHKQPDLLDEILAGSAAGAVAGVITYPLETMRTILAIPGASSGGLWGTCAKHYSLFGINGFYKVGARGVLLVFRGIGGVLVALLLYY